MLLKTIELKKSKSLNPKEIFSGYLDSDFGTDTVTEAGITVDVHQLEKDATFSQIFTDPENQTMTKGQIMEFCTNHKGDLRQDGYATFFLFKEADAFSVANVSVRGYGLYVSVYPLSDGRVWFAKYAPLVVVPQHSLKSPSPQTLKPSETLSLESALKIVKKAGYVVYKEM